MSLFFIFSPSSSKGSSVKKKNSRGRSLVLSKPASKKKGTGKNKTQQKKTFTKKLTRLAPKKRFSPKKTLRRSFRSDPPFWQAVSAAFLLTALIALVGAFILWEPAGQKALSQKSLKVVQSQLHSTAQKQLSSQAQSEVAKALADLQSLPFEEAFDTEVDIRISQIDSVLVTLLEKHQSYPQTHMRLGPIEIKTNDTKTSHSQVVEILTEGKEAQLIGALKKQLSLSTPSARVVSFHKNEWKIMVDGVETHHLFLFPTEKLFHEQKGSWSTSDKKKKRKSNEPALLVIVMDDLGMGMAPIKKLAGLSYPVTFAFWPYGTHTKEGALYAHKRDKEIIVHQPMEPMRYPQMQPGSNALFTRMSSSQISRTVEEALNQVPFAVGLNNHMGSRFTQSAPGVRSVLAVLRQRGLFALDSVTHNKSIFYKEAVALGVRAYQRQIFLDNKATAASIRTQLRLAEEEALRYGQAIAIGHPLPITLEVLEEWQKLRNPLVKIVRLQDLP